ncbi:hypothetical protein Tco_1549487 [Tanacetum coccineum]
MDLMNRVYKSYLDKFVIVFIDDISICSSRNKEYKEHLRLILGLLKNKELYYNDAEGGVSLNIVGEGIKLDVGFVGSVMAISVILISSDSSEDSVGTPAGRVILFEVIKKISLRDDAIVRVSDEPHLEQDIDPDIQAEIDEYIAYADAFRDRGIDTRVVVRVTHPVDAEIIPEPTTQALREFRRAQGTQIVGVESAVIALTERIAELERDNKRLRGTASVESQRVDRTPARHVTFDLLTLLPHAFGIFVEYNFVSVVRKKPNTTNLSVHRLGEEFDELVNRRVAEEWRPRGSRKDPEPQKRMGMN